MAAMRLACASRPQMLMMLVPRLRVAVPAARLASSATGSRPTDSGTHSVP
jgi:hypothetical protein